MKVSIDGILDTARKMNSQIQFKENPQKSNMKDIKTDQINIETRVDYKLNSINEEFKRVQSSLTKNQIFYNVLNLLKDDLANGGKNKESIISKVRFDDIEILNEYSGKDFSESDFNVKIENISNLIKNDISKLRIMQIELENILASNFTGSKELVNKIKNMESLFMQTNLHLMSNLYKLNSEIVMNLIK